MCEKRLRVWFISGNGANGGSQIGLRRFLQESTAHDYAVVVGGGGAALSELPARVSTYTLPAIAGLRGLLGFAWRLTRLCWRERPDVIVANNYLAIRAVAVVPKRFARIRAAYVRSLPDHASHPFRRSVFRWILQSRFTDVIANSAWTASCLPAPVRERAFVSYPVSGTAGIGVGAHSRGSSELRVLQLGRLDEGKGLHTLLDAVGILERSEPRPLLSVRICGEPVASSPDFARGLEAKASDLQTSVVFAGFTSDVPGELARADVLVACSDEMEAFGQVVVQGMSAGLVTISSSVGGPAEIIEDGVDGLLVPPGDAEQLARHLAWILSNPYAAEQMGHRARESSKRFSDERAIQMLESILREIATHRPSSGGRNDNT